MVFLSYRQLISCKHTYPLHKLDEGPFKLTVGDVLHCKGGMKHTAEYETATVFGARQGKARQGKEGKLSYSNVSSVFLPCPKAPNSRMHVIKWQELLPDLE